MAKFPFPTDPIYSAVTIAYRNKRMIADDVLPRRKVGKSEFRYLEHDLSEGFTVPNTMVGRKSRPDEVSFTATEQRGTTEDHALDDAIPLTDMDAAPAGYDPVGHSVMTITHLIMLDREIRVANLVFAAATYLANRKIQLSGTSQFSDFANSDPIGVISDGLDSCIIRPNVMTIGREAFSKLVQHPDIVKAAHGNSGDKGYAKRQDIADLFELDKVVVGEGYVNTAKKGQPVSLARVWGKHVSLLYTGTGDGGQEEAVFGFTAQYGDRLAGRRDDPDIGMRGGVRVRVGESVAEVISAADLGYFIEDAVA